MPSGATRWTMIPNAALAELLAADREREGEPFGGFAGERAAPPPEPSPPASPPLVIEPPPWAANGEPDPPRGE